MALRAGAGFYATLYLSVLPGRARAQIIVVQAQVATGAWLQPIGQSGSGTGGGCHLRTNCPDG